MGGNYRKKYYEPQLERTKFLSLFHSLKETPILFTSDLMSLQKSIQGWGSEAINGHRTEPNSDNLNSEELNTLQKIAVDSSF